MAEMGQLLSSEDVRRTTALPPKAEVHPRSCYVAQVPQVAVSNRSKPTLFRSPPAERYGMSGRGCGSLWFDVGSSDHLAPLLSLIDYEGFKIGKGARKHRAT
jgi:hypothetical protein